MPTITGRIAILPDNSLAYEIKFKAAKFWVNHLEDIKLCFPNLPENSQVLDEDLRDNIAVII